MQTSTLVDILTKYLPHIGWGSIITSCATVVWLLIRLAFKANGFLGKVTNEWSEAKRDIAKSKEILETATSNHLSHIEASTERTAQAVEKLADATSDNTLALTKVVTLLETQTYGKK